MKTNPKSDQELQEMNMMPEGEYDFVVTNAENKVSKSGNDMISLKLRVWDNQGHENIIFDYILEALAFKLKHFCEATGLLRNYEDGNLDAEDCLDRSGRVEIGRQEAQNGYAAKNIVVDYIFNKQTEGKIASLPKMPFDDPVPDFGNPAMISEEDIPL